MLPSTARAGCPIRSCRRSATAGTTSTRSTQTVSYLESWAWQEAAGLNTQEIHVNLRGYPGQTAIPKTCEDVTTVNGKTFRKKIALLPGSPRNLEVDESGITATMYTVNHGRRLRGTSSSPGTEEARSTPLSEHVAVPLTFSKVVVNLKKMLDGLVLVPPDDLMRLTRRQALAGTAGAIAGAAGIYALVDEHNERTCARPPAPSTLPPEQHLLDGVQVITDNGVEVLVASPPRGRDGDRPRPDDLGAGAQGSRGGARGAGVASTPRRRPGSGSPSHGDCRTSGAHISHQWARLQPIDDPTRSRPALARRAALLERPGRNGARGRTMSPSSCAATASQSDRRGPRRRSSTTSTGIRRRQR